MESRRLPSHDSANRDVKWNVANQEASRPMDKEAGIGVVAVFLFMKHMIARDFWLGGGDSGAVVGQNHGIVLGLSEPISRSTIKIAWCLIFFFVLVS